MNSKLSNNKLSKGEETKRKILDSAVKLFIENGYAATTTRQITDGLGMTRGIIYNYFHSKEEIFRAVIEKWHPWLQIIPVVQEAEGKTIEEFVHNAANLLVQRWDQYSEYTRLHFIELIEFRGQHLSYLFQLVFNQMITTIKEKTKKNQSLKGISTAVLSRSLLGLFFGYLMGDRFSSLPLDENQSHYTFDYFADIYLKGVISEVSTKINEENK